MARRKKSHSTTEKPTDNAAGEQARKDEELVTRWLKAIEGRLSAEEHWRTKQAPSVVERFRDDRKGMGSDGKRFNVLWANTETLKPAVFARMPVPDVRRRYATKDAAARTAALIGERALSYYMECAELEDTLDRSVEDYLLPGRATCVIRYKATIGEERVDAEPLPDDDEKSEYVHDTAEPPRRFAKGTQFDAGGAYQMQERVLYHEVTPEYQPWDLFVFGQAKTWRKVPWIALGCLMSKSEVKAQYQHLTPAQCDKIKFTHSMRVSKEGHDESGSFALFWDIWDKLHRTFIVVTEGLTDAPVTVQDDPLNLEDFYPVPEPMYSLRTNQDWTPKPEYLLYQDQALALDEATERLDALTSALKIRGVSDQAFDNDQVKLSRILSMPDLTLIPIANFRGLVEKGGLQAIIDTLPLDKIAAAMDKLQIRVQTLKAVIDEVTGISDIVRGKTTASETLGAQQLKAQYSGLRVSKRQARFGRYCRDIFRKAFEIIVEHVDPETLKIVSGVNVVPDAMYAQMKEQQQLEVGTISESEFAAAIQLLKSDRMRGFKVEVEADSTIPADKEAEQRQRVEFLGMVAQYLQQVMPAVQSGLVPPAVAREGLLFGVRAFKVGSEFEEVLEQLGQGQDDEAIRKQLQQLQQQAQQLGEENAKLKEANEKLKSDEQAKLVEARVDSVIKEKDAEQDRRLKEWDAAQDRRLKAQQELHEQQGRERDQQHQQQQSALQSRFEQRLDMAREQPIKAAKSSADGSQKMLGEVVKVQRELSAAVQQLGKLIAAVAAPKAPSRKRGRAQLPSGGFMEFEIGDAEVN
jgi:hypothetical protein